MWSNQWESASDVSSCTTESSYSNTIVSTLTGGTRERPAICYELRTSVLCYGLSCQLIAEFAASRATLFSHHVSTNRSTAGP